MVPEKFARKPLTECSTLPLSIESLAVEQFTLVVIRQPPWSNGFQPQFQGDQVACANALQGSSRSRKAVVS